MANTALDQIKKLDDQRNKLLDGARHEALARAQEAIDDLNTLGFNYVVVEEVTRSKGARKSVREKKDAPCPICNFKTNPPHDGRRHRSQGNKKSAFSNQELAGMGYSKA